MSLSRPKALPRLSLLAVALLAIPTPTVLAQAPTFDWDRAFSGFSAEQSRAIDIDADGNTYVAGAFQDDINFRLRNHVRPEL